MSGCCAPQHQPPPPPASRTRMDVQATKSGKVVFGEVAHPHCMAAVRRAGQELRHAAVQMRPAPAQAAASRRVGRVVAFRTADLSC